MRLTAFLAQAATMAVMTTMVVAPAQAAPVAPGVIRPVRGCAELVRDYAIPGAATHVVSATLVEATGTEPAQCDVRGYVEPAVNFKLRLPTDTYRGRYVQHGCPGECGVMEQAPPECGPRNPDLAVAQTDDGHVGKGDFPANISDASWAENNQAARDDFYFRAPHVVSVAVKKLIQRFYGAPPKQSYFFGCSTGGREGLILAQRYPHDFDGISVGSPAIFLGPLNGIYIAFAAKTNMGADGQSILTREKLPALHNAVLAACDHLDGLVDGQLDDPRRCRFDPGTVQCSAGTDGPNCLTPAQVAVVRKLYDGPRDPDGTRLYPGWQTRGSELSWDGHLVPNEFSSARPFPDQFLQYMAYPIGRPQSSLAEIEFTVEELRRLKPESIAGNAASLDMREFRRSGGKLIMWSGWDDQSIPAVGMLDYYQRVWQRSGGLQATQQWLRTYVIPSKYHAWTGGSRLTEFETFNALVDWVERGRAPVGIVATGTNPEGGPRARPVYPYPLVARYDGTGSVDEARNFVPVRPPGRLNDVIDWAGEDLHHRPGPVAR
ncbi:tannase/feruloyl esterase family alpha/beta hydrolase [Micromonospora sp. RHAY321]|uniref:tannase/feruloyl esterase family alpha/beta hydrolase n=1 Tax=Micromonospora sp. RHAY321 TaxID=2944807 RepID=UPI00207CEBEA|nr:tannase/feruloyl esterase family alpha/beta hydrolase [Micromonospora sp. RHAY321]MCO1597524.1 tannase/feruloyl esterase family alpha/beta hydrolase [Micromonospora sp. RHAY321]